MDSYVVLFKKDLELDIIFNEVYVMYGLIDKYMFEFCKDENFYFVIIMFEFGVVFL